MISLAFQPAVFILPVPTDSHVGQKPLFFCVYVCRTPRSQWRYIESLLLLAGWDEEVLGDLLPEAIVFCSSSTFLQIAATVNLLMTEDSHLRRPRSGFMLLCRIR